MFKIRREFSEGHPAMAARSKPEPSPAPPSLGRSGRTILVKRNATNDLLKQVRRSRLHSESDPNGKPLWRVLHTRGQGGKASLQTASTLQFRQTVIGRQPFETSSRGKPRLPQDKSGENTHHRHHSETDERLPPDETRRTRSTTPESLCCGGCVTFGQRIGRRPPRALGLCRRRRLA